MARAAKPPRTGTRPLKALSTATLDELIEEAIVDAYDESEQTSGFYSMIEEHLAIPFDSGSRSSTCHALMSCPQDGRGSRPTGDGRAGDRSWPPSPR
jgi:hypothetical protein